MLVAGRAERDPQLGPSLAAFAERAAIPLLAEPLSGARRGAGGRRALRRAAARRPVGGGAQARPRAARRRPARPPSRCASGCTGSATRVQIAFDPEHAWQDPAGAVSTIVGADPRSTLATVGERLPPRRDRVWLDGWLAADGAAAPA